MRVRKCRSAGPVHLYGCQIDGPRDQRRAGRAKGNRLGQTRVTTPPGDFGQVERPSSLMDCRKRRRPAARPAEPTVRMGRVRTRLLLAESNGHIDATTGEPSYGDRSIENHPACGEVAARRQPQGQTVNPSARPPVTHVRKGQVPSNLVPVLAKPVAMQNRRRFAMNPLVLAENSFLEQRCNRGDAASCDGRPEAQPRHHRASVDWVGRPR